jgi:hypothetical protein
VIQRQFGAGGADSICGYFGVQAGQGAVMSDWIHNLPVPLMALAIFAFTYLLAIIIFAAVSALATGERAKSFQAISPGMLPVLGIIFGLFVAFTAAQVWSDNDRASAAVSREASALRAVMLFAAGLPPEQEGRLRPDSWLRRANRNGGMADDGAPKGVTEGGSCCFSRGAAASCLDDAAGRGPTDRATRNN